MSTILDLNNEFSNIQRNTEGDTNKLAHAIEHVSWVTDKIEIDKATTVTSATKIACYRGQIFWARLGRNIGSEENKRRPVMVLQNDKGNRFGPTTLVAPISDDTSALRFPVNVEVKIQGPDPVTADS